MSIPDASLPLVGLAVLGFVMALAWRRQLRTQNAGIVDVLWTAGLGGLAILYAAAAEGWLPRRVLIAALVGGWSLRLAWHLAVRVSNEPEDGRYAALRREHGEGFDRWTFFFFQAQALVAVLLSLVFFVPATWESEGWRAWDAIAVLLWTISIVGEAVADRQLSAWRRDPGNKGRTCRAGLWQYSRHPNYFFEWIHWLVYPVLAFGSPWGWATWLAPALMLFLVLRVTGIPPTEARALESRGDDYRAYQRTTNAFFPGRPRPDQESLSTIS